MTSAMNVQPGTELTFESVIAIRAQVLHDLKRCSEPFFCLNLSQVQYCDSAGLALLIEIKKLCTQKNKILTIENCSTDIQDLAEFCGVKDILMSHFN